MATLASEWIAVIEKPGISANFSSIPGQLQLLGNAKTDYRRVEYIIWKNPWMAISRNTFTGDILCKLGYGDLLCANVHDYPELTAEEMNDTDTDTFYLFSLEPFPFQRHAERN